MKISLPEAVTFILLVVCLVAIIMRGAQVQDLYCRVARMETLASSSDPLPDCEETER